MTAIDPSPTGALPVGKHVEHKLTLGHGVVVGAGCPPHRITAPHGGRCPMLLVEWDGMDGDHFEDAADLTPLPDPEPDGYHLLADGSVAPREGHPADCPGPHDHLIDDGNGDRPGATTCGDCGRQAFYCYTTDRYHHGERPDRGCRLIPAEPVR